MTITNKLWDIDAALAKVLEFAGPLPVQTSAFDALVLNRVLANDVYAIFDSPPFTKSLMDGYAVRASDGLTPRVVSTTVVQAGEAVDVEVKLGEAVRIFTGAKLPEGADAVVMQERTSFNQEQKLVIEHAVKAGQNVLAQGTEYKAGEVILQKGTEVTPAVFAVLAGLGYSESAYIPIANVAIVTTGNELAQSEEDLQAGKILNTNGPMLMTQTLRAGASAFSYTHAVDTEEDLRNKFEQAMENSDVLITSGGVSVGDYDLVPKVLKDLGVEIHLHSVRMKPGKPFLFGTKDKKLVFGLPGNPLSAYVGFEVFVRPALLQMMGLPATQQIPATLAKPLAANHDRPTFVPVILHLNRTVTPLPWFGSANLKALVPANGFVRLPEGSVSYSTGDTVMVLPTD